MIPAPTDDVAATGFEPGLLAQLRATLPSADSLVTLPWPGRVTKPFASAVSASRALLIGPQIQQPVAVAEQLARRERPLPIVLVCPRALQPELSAASHQHPLLGRNTHVIATDALDSMPELLAQLRRRRSAKRRHAELVQSLNMELSAATPATPDRTHYLDQLLNHAPIGVVTVRGDTRIMAINHQAERYFGMDATPARAGDRLGDWFAEDQRATLERIVGEVARGAESSRGQVEFHRGADMRHFSVVGAPVDQVETEGTVMLIFQDLTDLIELQRAEELAREQAEAANLSKSRLLAGVSHELRTPMNAISGFSEMIMREMFGPVGNDRYQEYSRLIFDSAQHLTALIDDLLDLSKIEAGVLEPSEEEVDLHVLAGECIQLLAQQAEARGHSLTLRCGEGRLPVMADRRMLRQVVINLMSNAIKFTQNGGQITVSVERREDGCIIDVTDNGAGIPKDEIDKVLRPFERGLHTASRFVEGSGLGLFLVHRIVTLHRGRMKIDSTPGQGTQVTIMLPWSRAAAPPA